MHSAIESMFKKYNPKSIQENKRVLHEIIQEIALLGLSRSGFFSKAAFYGGTALRIFHGLDRFSEDLDFSLLIPDQNFKLKNYTKYVQDELGAYGLNMKVEEKDKKADTAVKSAFIKGGTIINLMEIESISIPVKGINANEKIKIKLEVDTNPPPGAEYEVKFQLEPVPYSVRIYSLSSLFAGKVHAVLCRGWRSRVKGRDFYDYIWYLSKNVELDIHHLSYRMKQSGHLETDEELTETKLRNKLTEKFSKIDFDQAKNDVLPFVKDPRKLELWSEDFFKNITNDKLVVPKGNDHVK
ncbi:MAG: nucleotidyl transferase AbiEii/AbiGii toxin family protein [Candidatus Cloacimonetes bacterium]|nr:nucleotidyl transferase AbiEii/AbiGii toxin family protein [Candidatus Cloacimonadota bacterium]MCF7814198.1 nucleotidyl transferase AbiEii/AbiGii toxin family protein [Candidatus Cloacimonadota bacterium]MCF7868853.1 nucleotidyl transferase AbiEii/AbiGii toxin family protein [Candidatus Cloacimonadota bacterium]MCF7884254.1 nucleotidyl transferase AbiEii/AbiGii toxin family protein [Candidatus Cloacimonadota bacterium]